MKAPTRWLWRPEFEQLITSVYQKAERIALPALPNITAGVTRAEGGTGVIPDLRGAPSGLGEGWVGAALTGSRVGPSQAESFPRGAIVALPDAPGHFRLLTNRGPMSLVRELGAAELGRAALGVAPLGAASANGRPWEALLLLLRAELIRLPRSYAEALVVDAYLIDLATATGNISVIGSALDDLRQHCPGARIGVEVNAAARLVPHIPAIASRLDLVVALGTTQHSTLDGLAEMLPSSTELVVKTGVLPHEILEIGWNEPERWTSGRGRLVVHWSGAPGLRQAHNDALESAKLAAGSAHV